MRWCCKAVAGAPSSLIKKACLQRVVHLPEDTEGGLALGGWVRWMGAGGQSFILLLFLILLLLRLCTPLVLAWWCLLVPVH